MTEAVQSMTPAQPTTAAQRARYRRILELATTLVVTGGEDALQISEVPALAHVSLATLYRYFPSKQHLLFAVVQTHMEAVLTRAQPNRRPDSSIRERTADHLLRVFRADQRVPKFGALVRRLSTIADPAFGVERDRLTQVQVEILLRSVGPVNEYQKQVMWLVIGATNAAIALWMAGILAASEVRFQILTACRLLDLTPEIIDEDRRAARRAGR